MVCASQQPLPGMHAILGYLNQMKSEPHSRVLTSILSVWMIVWLLQMRDKVKFMCTGLLSMLVVFEFSSCQVPVAAASGLLSSWWPRWSQDHRFWLEPDLGEWQSQHCPHC